MKALTIIAAAAIAALALTGCSTFAVYQNPYTGVRVECENAPIFGRQKAEEFSDCKDGLERQGYERIGTRTGDYQKGGDQPQPAK